MISPTRRARRSPRSRSPTPGRPPAGCTRSAAPVRRMGDGGHGPFQRLRRTPEEVRALLPPGPRARRDRRPAPAPPAAGADRARRPHPRRAPADLHPGDRPRPGRPAARGAGPGDLRGPRPDAAGDHRGGAADAARRRDARRAAARPGGAGLRGDPRAVHRGHALRRRPARAGAARAGLRQPRRPVALARRHPAAQPAAGDDHRPRSTTCSTAASRCPSGTPRPRSPRSWPGSARRGGTAAWSSSSPASPAPASPPSPAAWPTRCGRAASGPSRSSTATWCGASCPPGWASAKRRPGRATCGGSAGSPPRSPGTAGMAIACPIAPYAERARSGARGWPWRPAPASCWCTWHAARGLRATRPQGPVRPGPRRAARAA